MEYPESSGQSSTICQVMYSTRKSYPASMVELETQLLELVELMYTYNPFSVLWALVFYLSILATAAMFHIIILPPYFASEIVVKWLFDLQ